MSRLLFIQARGSRGGAQTSLVRLLRSAVLRQEHAAVLCGDADSWLVRDCAAAGVTTVVQPLPRSRSLTGRLWSNGRFARAVARRLPYLEWIVANDHIEALLARSVARATGGRWAVILRTPGMTDRDFLKYGCGDANVAYAVGTELQAQARRLAQPARVLPYREGLAEGEFWPPAAKAPDFPHRILVVGNELPRKGWGDLRAALDHIDAAGLPALELDFTGNATPEWSVPSRHRARFLGRVEGFTELVRGYALAVHPSRHESFGLAPLEILAAGVPVLCSEAGEMDARLLPPELRFPPGDVEALAARLVALWRDWPQIDFGLVRAQARLRERYALRDTAAEFLAALRGVAAVKMDTR